MASGDANALRFLFTRTNWQLRDWDYLTIKWPSSVYHPFRQLEAILSTQVLSFLGQTKQTASLLYYILRFSINRLAFILQSIKSCFHCIVWLTLKFTDSVTEPINCAQPRRFSSKVDCRLYFVTESKTLRTFSSSWLVALPLPALKSRPPEKWVLDSGSVCWNMF